MVPSAEEENYSMDSAEILDLDFYEATQQWHVVRVEPHRRAPLFKSTRRDHCVAFIERRQAAQARS